MAPGLAARHRSQAGLQRATGERLRLPGEEPSVPFLKRLNPEQRDQFRVGMDSIRQRFDSRMGVGNWPERGAPFDEYDGEGHLLGADAWAEQKRMREGHA